MIKWPYTFANCFPYLCSQRTPYSSSLFAYPQQSQSSVHTSPTSTQTGVALEDERKNSTHTVVAVTKRNIVDFILIVKQKFPNVL